MYSTLIKQVLDYYFTFEKKEDKHQLTCPFYALADQKYWFQ